MIEMTQFNSITLISLSFLSHYLRTEVKNIELFIIFLDDLKRLAGPEMYRFLSHWVISINQSQVGQEIYL